MSFFRLHLPRLGWRTQLALGKRASNYCHALMWHLLVDDEKRTMTWSFVLPGLFAWVTEHPTPVWRKLALWLSNGAGEQARYGFQHTWAGLDLFWRRVINLPNHTAQGGWAWMRSWKSNVDEPMDVESDLTGQVGTVGNAWASKEGVSKWRFLLRTRIRDSGKWWIPDWVSHRFLLTCTVGEHSFEHEAIQEGSFEQPSAVVAFEKLSASASEFLAKYHP